MKELENCWNIKGCPASHYIKCEAYRRRVDCWALSDRRGCLCHLFETCDPCPIYRKHLESNKPH